MSSAASSSNDEPVTDPSLDVEKEMEELVNKFESLLQESNKMQDDCVGLQKRIVSLYGKLGEAKLAVDKTLDELEEFEKKSAIEAPFNWEQEQPGEKTPPITVYPDRLPEDMGVYFEGLHSSPPPLHHKSSSM